MASLDENKPARAVALTEEESALVKGLQLLTMKPMIYAANVAESDLADEGASNHHVKALREKAAHEGCEVIIVSAQASNHRTKMPRASWQAQRFSVPGWFGDAIAFSRLLSCAAFSTSFSARGSACRHVVKTCRASNTGVHR